MDVTIDVSRPQRSPIMRRVIEYAHAQCLLQELMPNRKQNGIEEIPHQTLFTVRE